MKTLCGQLILLMSFFLATAALSIPANANNSVCIWDDIHGLIKTVTVYYYDEVHKPAHATRVVLANGGVGKTKIHLPTSTGSILIFRIWPSRWYHSMRHQNFPITQGSTLWIYGNTGRNLHEKILPGDYCH